MNHGLLIKPRDSDWHIDQGKIEFKAVGSGDWTKYQWFDENQRNPNFDNDGCACYAAQKVIDAQMDAIWPTLPQDVQTWIIDNGYLDQGKDGNMHFHSSPRAIEILTGNYLNGNSIPECLDVVRKYGLVPYCDLPFTPTMTVAEYFSTIPQSTIDKGAAFLRLMGGKDFLQYHWLNDGTPKNTSLIQSAMLQAPLAIGIAVADNWNVTNPNPDPPANATPGHALMVDKMIAPATEVCDNYIPYEKILDAGYPINYCLQAVVRYIPPLPPAPAVPVQQNISAWSVWLSAVSSWLRHLLDPGSLGAARSPKWEEFKKEYAKTHLPVCAVCGGTSQLNLHHLKPFHVFPELELDPANVIWLCNAKRHHIEIGHLGNFQSINPHGLSDVNLWRDKERNKPLTPEQIKADFNI